MPIYEFQCQACGAEVEVLQKISDPHITDCESCGKSEMKKKVTAAAFRLSGAGWYETDFKKDGDSKKNLTDGTTKKESTDTKSAKSSDAKSSESSSSKSETVSKETPKPTKSKEKSSD